MQVGSGALACAALWHSSSSRPPYLRGRLPRQHSGEQSSFWQGAQETWVWSLGGEMPWRRKWQPTPVFLPGKFHGQRSPVGFSPWARRVSAGPSAAQPHLTPAAFVSQLISVFLSSGTPPLDDSTLSLPFRTLGQRRIIVFLPWCYLSWNFPFSPWKS